MRGKEEGGGGGGARVIYGAPSAVGGFNTGIPFSLQAVFLGWEVRPRDKIF
jgi:hypothetical protein